VIKYVVRYMSSALRVHFTHFVHRILKRESHVLGEFHGSQRNECAVHYVYFYSISLRISNENFILITVNFTGHIFYLTLN
jgi:hypothetical protein